VLIRAKMAGTRFGGVAVFRDGQKAAIGLEFHH
jgi:hypothetical protein